MISNNESKYVLMDSKKNSLLTKSYQFFYSQPRIYITFLFLTGLVLFTFPILMTLNYIKLNIIENNFDNNTYMLISLVIIIKIMYFLILLGLKIHQLTTSIRYK
jgi:surface polysaccharide O-acyltransferase-like enzyme